MYSTKGKIKEEALLDKVEKLQGEVTWAEGLRNEFSKQRNMSYQAKPKMSPMRSNANIRTLDCGEEYGIYCKVSNKDQTGEQAAHAQKTWPPQWLSGKGFLKVS